MSTNSISIEQGLKTIVKKRVVGNEKQFGSYSWICFANYKIDYEGCKVYKMAHTLRLDDYSARIKRDSEFNEEETIVVKVWGNTRYLTKIFRRIFKPNKVRPSIGGKDWYQLKKEERDWLINIGACDSFVLESDVADFLGANSTAELRKEGLF